VLNQELHNQSPSDGDLMDRLVRGELDVLGTLYLRHGDAVLRFLCRTLLDAQAAEDLCQEVFLAVPRAAAAGRYREEGRLRPWLIGIASRKARAWRRRQWIREIAFRRFIREKSSPGFPQDDPAESKQGIERIAEALSRLPHSQREALMLQVGEDMTGAQIAETLGVSHSSVRVRLHRARLALRAALEGTLDGKDRGDE